MDEPEIIEVPRDAAPGGWDGEVVVYQDKPAKGIIAVTDGVKDWDCAHDLNAALAIAKASQRCADGIKSTSRESRQTGD